MRISVALLVFLTVGLAACGDPRVGPPPTIGTPDGVPTIVTVNYPLAYFAERIGGDAIRVLFPAPRDEDPAFWEPDDAAIAIYQAADRVLLNGATYAKWVPKVSLATSKLVDTSSGARDRYIEIQETATHAHGPEGEHEHGGIAFTTWLDLDLAKVQADAVRDALIELLPEQKEALEANALALRGDLDSLDAAIRRAVQVDPQRPLVGSHPVYQYLARAYGLNLLAVHWEPDVVPERAAWDDLGTMLETFPSKWMLWEGEPVEESVAGLRREGLDSRVFDPCGNRPETGDFLTVMQQNVKNLEEVFAE